MRERQMIRSVRAIFVAVAAIAAAGCYSTEPGPDVTFFHAPEKFDRRSDDFTANVTGTLGSHVESARFRVNGGDWKTLPQGKKRVEPPEFAVEIDAQHLKTGSNRLEVATDRSEEPVGVEFAYDPSPISLPIEVDWRTWPLVADDGYWERYESADGTWRVRPVPGYEGFDRILVVAGAFAQGRRVETDMVFRHSTAVERQEWGFGLLPLWGGRPDTERSEPLRRGWLFGISWFFNRYRGVGLEFSFRDGTLPPKFTTSFNDWVLDSDVKYRIVSEAFREVRSDGSHAAYRQRMKWWKDGEPAPERWIELVDVQGAPLPARPYGVALVTFRTQVDYGPVSILPLPDRIVGN
jgi:hypothetical protein